MFHALKTLLLLALLAITGEVAAVDCGSGDKHQVAADNPHYTSAVTAAGAMEKPATCSHDQCEKGHITSHQDCDSSCNCCPGHCANVIPASIAIAEFISYTISMTAYRPLDSTPAPESTIRPPIPA